MSEKKDPFQEAVEFLSHDRRFLTILGEIGERRELLIGKLRNYKDTTELQKVAAEICAHTDFLDLFGVPTGTPVPPA
jgi:hypothetical protein